MEAIKFLELDCQLGFLSRQCAVVVVVVAAETPHGLHYLFLIKK